MSKRKILTIFILIIFLFNGCNKFKNDSLKYEEFNKITKNIYNDVILKNYKDSIVQQPIVTVYPGNPQKRWSLDKFDVVNNNAMQPRSITFFVIQDKFVSKIDLTYQADITKKLYLNVSRVTPKRESLLDKPIKMPMIASNSFTTNGIFFQVTTFSLENIESYSEEKEEKLLQHNIDITSKIQEYILEKGI